ncbi:hypothetical protein BGZ46_008426 [Entomortierella lignicola]|nr:hypothetical protein BGZ46_008426 [Entomortierella lignicola]
MIATTMTDAQISDHLLREGSMNGSTLSYLPDREPKPRAGMPSPPLIRPPSAIESIFPELSPTTPSSSRSSRYVKDVNSAENIGESDYFAITKTDDFLATDGLEIAINDTQISTNPGKSITRPRAKRRHANLPAPLIIPTPSSTFASIHKFENSSDTVKKDSSKQPVVTPGDESTIKIKDLGVDDSFDEEYHHQYPAISAYQSAQGLFNVLPSPKSVSYQEMTSLLRQSMTPSPVSDINWEGHSFKDLSGDDYRTILNTGPLNIPAVTESRNDEEQTSRSPFNDKNQVVAKWAHEQAKIHEWRMEKKRVQALRGIRKTGSTSSADLKSWEDSISDPEHTSGEQETIVPVFDKGYSEI